MYSRFFSKYAGLAIITVVFFITCTSNPTSPYDPSNAKMHLLVKSSTGIVTSDAVTDTVGNMVNIGINGNLPTCIDSVKLWVTIRENNKLSDSVLAVVSPFTSSSKYSDTAWYNFVFNDTGIKAIKGTAYIQKGYTFTDSINAIIYPKRANRKPVLSFTGDTAIVPSGNCLLSVSVSDSDVNQKDTIILLQGPAKCSFVSSAFSWIAPATFTGVDSAVFVAYDNGVPVMYDTLTVHIIVTDTTTKVKHPPVWQDSVITLSRSVGNALNLTLTNYCSDADSDALTFKLLSGTPAGDTIKDSVYSFTPASADTGVFNVEVVAKDSSGLSDTVTLHITITAGDTFPPEMKLVIPVKDSVITNASSYTVTLMCKDSSGIASVIGVLGTISFAGIKESDSVWTINVGGLIKDTFNMIVFTATDKSLKSNKSTLTLHIKYDPTIADAEGPVIKKISGPSDTVSSSSVTIVDSITDPSVVDSVYAVLNSSTTKMVLAGTSNKYTYTGTLTEGANTIVITAKDKSAAGNISTQTINVYYVIAPAITTQPTDYATCPGNSVTLSAIASGTSPLIYKWYKGTSRVGKTDSTSGSFKISALAVTDTGYYKMTVSNWAGSVSDSAKISVTKYTIAFNSNGGSSVDTQKVICNGTATTPTAPTRSGYKFSGWYSDEQYNSVFIFTTLITGNTTLYAKWTTIYIVTYNGNGSTDGNVPIDTNTYTNGTAVTVLDNTGKLIKTNYTFGGWNTNAAGTGTTYSALNTITIGNVNVTLYAKWVIDSFTIYFDGQSPTVAAGVTSTRVAYGNTVGSLPTDPIKTGCTFKGWWTGKISSGTQFIASTTVTANDTVYAKWTITDYDGNVYNTVTIGNQVWTVENLRTTHFNNDTAISNVTDSTLWLGLSTPGYCWYNNDSATYNNYGILYNWYVASYTDTLISGWHVPTGAEWDTLAMYLGGDSVAGGKLKEAGTTHWTTPNTGATNETGYSALPGGLRDGYSNFGSIGSYGELWSATIGGAPFAYGIELSDDGIKLSRCLMKRRCGFSVRLVRN